MQWELENVEPVECTLDDSGIYAVINRVMGVEYGHGAGTVLKAIRVDVLTTDGDEPLRSFVGPGNDVRKRVIAWLWNRNLVDANCLSSEHASYIGYEIARAMTDENYVQN